MLLFTRWLVFNKIVGYYWIVAFIAGAIEILITSGPSKYEKCGSEKIVSGDNKITSGGYKYAKKDGC
jgi:hypothetical protein